MQLSAGTSANPPPPARMRNWVPKILAALSSLTVAGCAASQTPLRGAPSPRSAQRCVQAEPVGSLRLSDADPRILIYSAGKSTWINRLPRTCRFRAGDVLVLSPDSRSLCRGELVRSVDPVTRIPGASCVLGDFVPDTP